MRILILARHSGAHQSPQAFLVERLVAALVDIGHRVTIVTESPRPSHLQADTIVVKNRWQPGLAKLLRLIPFGTRFDLPNFQFRGWISAARLEIVETKPQVVISFSNPYFLNVIGLYLSRSFRGVKWIAHYSDPIIDNPYKQVSWAELYRLKLIERKILTESSGVVFCNENLGAQTLQRHKFAAQSPRVAIIPHSYGRLQGPERARNDNPITFRHVGSLYGPRRVDAVVAAFEGVRTNHTRDFIVEFVGSEMLSGPASSRKTTSSGKSWVRRIPVVSREESLELMESSSVLFTVDSVKGSKVFLPSKLTDYIGARRPVLVFSTPGSPSWEIGAQLGFFLANLKSQGEMFQAVTDCLEGFANWRPRETEVEKFSSTEIGKRWSEFLEEIVRS